MNENKKLFFETIKCFEGEPYNLNYHNKRIAKTIGKNIDLNEYIYPISDELLKCKVIYSSDEIIDICYSKYAPKNPKRFKIIINDEINYKYKSLDREEIETLYNLKQEADEIIIVKDGYVTDTSIANIAIEKNGIWFTPNNPLLEGTTRERLLELGSIKKYPLTLQDLKSCTKLAIMNAMIGFQEVKEFELIV